MEQLHQLVTEARSAYTDLDALGTMEILKIMNEEDHNVAPAVKAVLPEIERAVDAIVRAFQSGGRLIYIGAGTSGRLGVLDASEAPPTFGVSGDMIQGIIAGGERAIRFPVEDAEDNMEAGATDIVEAGVRDVDVVVGIAASGRTPYVIGALQKANDIGATTVAVVNNRQSPVGAVADIDIAPVVGPEVLLGSTRMKAGTAQKLVLNMLSTVSMIKIGKTYSNLMVDLQVSNEKLWARGIRIVQLATDAPEGAAEEAFRLAGGRPKVAIIMLLTGLKVEQAENLLEQAGGFVRGALELSGE